MVNGVVAVPGWSGHVNGNARGCATGLHLEAEQRQCKRKWFY